MECTAESLYLGALNNNQLEAVRHTGKPLLILAGAGSGKTRVITAKIAYCIREMRIPPWAILAVTFTNKAAKEMSERAALMEARAADSMIRTFHSFGAWLLRRNAEAAGLASNFVIYDSTDAAALLGTVINKKKDEINLMAHAIARAKDKNISPQSDELAFINHTEYFKTAYQQYEERLRHIGNVDFGDLIVKPIMLLKNNPAIAARLRDRFRVILIDEYQDTNTAQFELIKELFSPESYLCAVGDDDQSIYRFRGAEISNILRFSDMFGGADIIKLEKNYRSTAEILELANKVIHNNNGRHLKTLNAARGGGKRPQVFYLPNQDYETQLCADIIQRPDHEGKRRYADWAVLYRTNAQSLGFETEFVRRKIPYKVVAGMKFYEREEIKDALALLSFMVNPRDEVSFRRIVNKPARGIGGAAIERILAERWNEDDWNIEQVLKRIADTFPAKTRTGIKTFLKAIETGRAALGGRPVSENNEIGELRCSEGLSRCVAILIESSGIAGYHLSHDPVSAEQRIGNLQELVNNAVLYEDSEAGLADFLERIELDRVSAQDEDLEDRVTLITLHNTKGLEYKKVIITGLEQGLFPRADKRDDDLEEERRLFYVGVTRAMDELYLTSCQTRRMWGGIKVMRPSQFLEEAGNGYLAAANGGPRSFTPQHGSDACSSLSYSGERNRVSSDGRWKLGDRVFHDNYGYGEVQRIKETEEGPVVQITFENGIIKKILSTIQSKNYMKIKD